MTWIALIGVCLAVALMVILPYLDKKNLYVVFLGTLPKNTRRALKDEKASLVLALKELDFDYETGKLSKDDYASLRDRYEARAVDVMKQLDEIESQWVEVQKHIDKAVQSQVRQLGS